MWGLSGLPLQVSDAEAGVCVCVRARACTRGSVHVFVVAGRMCAHLSVCSYVCVNIVNIVVSGELYAGVSLCTHLKGG